MKNSGLFKRFGFNVYPRGKDKNFSTFFLYDKEDFLDEKEPMTCVVSELEVYDMGDGDNESRLLSWKEIKNTEGLFEEVCAYLKLWLNGNVYPDTEEGMRRKEFHSIVSPPLEYLEKYNLFGPTGKSPFSYLNIKELLKNPACDEKSLRDLSVEGFNFKCYKNNNVYYCKCVRTEVGRSGNGEMILRVRSYFRIYDLFNKKEIGKRELKNLGLSEWFFRTIGMWINGKANPCVKNKKVINWHGAVVDNTAAIQKKKALIEEGARALSEDMFERDFSKKRSLEGNGNKEKKEIDTAPLAAEEAKKQEEKKIKELSELIQIGNNLCDFFRVGACDSSCEFVKDCEDIDVCQSKLTAKFLLSKGVKLEEG